MSLLVLAADCLPAQLTEQQVYHIATWPRRSYPSNRQYSHQGNPPDGCQEAAGSICRRTGSTEDSRTACDCFLIGRARKKRRSDKRRNVGKVEIANKVM